jgi:hypothetical protein
MGNVFNASGVEKLLEKIDAEYPNPPEAIRLKRRMLTSGPIFKLGESLPEGLDGLLAEAFKALPSDVFTLVAKGEKGKLIVSYDILRDEHGFPETIFIYPTSRLKGEFYITPTYSEWTVAEALDGVKVRDTIAQPVDKLGKISRELALATCNYDSLQSVKLFLDFILVLACSNVWTEPVEPPRKMQESRARKGREELIAYQTLVVGSTSGAVKGTGSGAGKALHFRRGHIRRYRDGKTVWIRQCIVGDKKNGVVAKDYKVA